MLSMCRIRDICKIFFRSYSCKLYNGSCNYHSISHTGELILSVSNSALPYHAIQSTYEKLIRWGISRNETVFHPKTTNGAMLIIRLLCRKFLRVTRMHGKVERFRLRLADLLCIRSRHKDSFTLTALYPPFGFIQIYILVHVSAYRASDIIFTHRLSVLLFRIQTYVCFYA